MLAIRSNSAAVARTPARRARLDVRSAAWTKATTTADIKSAGGKLVVQVGSSTLARARWP